MSKRSTNSQESAPKMVVSLDIGTTKTMIVMGYLRTDGKVEVCGYGKAKSKGVQYGGVFNSKETAESIREAVNELKTNVSEPVSEVYVGVAGRHICCQIATNKCIRQQGLDVMVQESEIQDMLTQMENYTIPNRDIITVIPQYYEVDGRCTLTPVGTFGQNLLGCYQVVHGDKQEVKQIKIATDLAQLTLKNLWLEPVASASVCLMEEEKQAGVALVDIGGGTTDIIIFESGVPLFVKVIPVGGCAITQDIAKYDLSYEQAEKLKIKHGTCCVRNEDKNNYITIPEEAGYSEARKLSEYNLAQIINARVANDILGAVNNEIAASGYANKVQSFVLTGGGAMLRDIQALAEYILHKRVRIGLPTLGFVELQTALKDPSYSTALGLLKTGCVLENTPYSPRETESNEDESGSGININASGLLKKLSKWFGNLISEEGGSVE